MSREYENRPLSIPRALTIEASTIWLLNFLPSWVKNKEINKYSRFPQGSNQVPEGDSPSQQLGWDRPLIIT
jgi:hypothetical protein